MQLNMSASREILQNEKELFVQMARGSEAAFTKIFYHYTPQIYHFILGKTKSEEITEEILQEVFIKVWNKREKFEEVTNFEDYLFTIAANNTYNFLRRMVNDEKLKKKVWESIQNFSNITEETLDLKESRALIDKAVDKLSPQKKKIFILSREQGLSHAEIAEQLNISPSTVNNQLTEALRFIKEYIKNTPSASLALLMMLMRMQNYQDQF